MTMKKFLLTTTALTAIASITNFSNASLTKAEWEVHLGGFIDSQIGFWTDNDDGQQTNREMRNDLEIHIHARDTAEVVGYGSIGYGVQIELDTSGSGVNIDEGHIFIDGEFGELQLGDEDGASDILAVVGPTNVGSGLLDGEFGNFIEDVPTAFKVTDSSDATKVTYISPYVSGVIAGVSYAFEEDGGDSVVTSDLGPRKHDFIEVGAKYAASSGNMNFEVGGGFSFHTVDDPETPLALNNESEEYFNWQVGVSMTFFGLQVGGTVVDYDDADGKELGFHGAASYENGPVAVGFAISYLPIGDEESLVLIGGATYHVAKGLQIYSEVFHYNNGLKDGVGMLSGVRVDF